ncbi:MAG TPA: DNA polymerase/3'-5' exonuclease PolX [Tangfeifania sp.]|nr:DNA polymerase/3'-5' exonuclease PolX [Tangfeifania sp.]
MPVHNKEITDKLNEVADLLDLKGENEFRVRAYRNAVRTISGLSKSVAEMEDNDENISSLPDIGDSMVEKIEEIVETGNLKQLEKLKKEIPSSLVEIMKLEQMGPERTKILYEELDIDSISDLKKAVEDGKVEELKGFGKKTADNIKREIKEYSQKGGSKRIKRSEAEEEIQPLIKYLEDKMDDVTIAGSFRRKKETVGDIDILATSDDVENAMKAFTEFDEVDRVLAHGEKKSSVKLRTGLQVDLRIVEKNEFGAALLYFTGSKEHSVALRKTGQEKDLKVNEYGVFSGKKKLAAKTEEKMYKALGLHYIEPELREDKGEFEAARNNNLPKLIEMDDIKGDLQTHSKASDGKYTIEEMVEAALDFGYEYYAVTDHSKKVSMANGLDEKRLAEQIEQIDELNGKMKKIKILKSVEVDILEDGSLDLPDDILKELDIVICSIHYNMNLSKKKQTRRILKAMENPNFNILAHPTGRRINERSPYDLDMEEIMKEAKDMGCFLEINANPDRLDLDDDNARMAKEIGLKLSISTDAHSVDNLNFMKYGVAQARRGWLEKDDVLNTRPWKDLKKLLKR